MKLNKLIIALAASGIATSAFATNGYFSHGNGMVAKGMGGAATAMTKDSFGGANNPATMVWVGNRYDAGVDAFSPVRAASATTGSTVTSSDNELFAVPEFGYNQMMNDKMSLGVTVYGNGGMNTDYATTGGYNMLGGTTALGVDLMQLIVAPTVSYKVNESTSVGFSPLLGYQRFEAYGLGAFADYSSSAANLTNNGVDDATGFGARVGFLTKLNSQVSLGAAYSSKVNMSKFDKYKGLFAEQGDFDLPANWNVGATFQPNDQLTVALDFQRIEYSGVKAVANSSGVLLTGGRLGADAGPGFGWSDMDIVKLGVEYKYSPTMTLRAGYSHTDAPMTGADVTFNILAPAVIEDHITLGMTYAMDKDSNLTVSYAHALENTITGNYLLGAGTGNIKMSQNSIGIAYSKKF
ncbi:MAG: long-chain fatty acid transporter [Betaproteobacteria bacterium]|nr:MAG: long-chain fatty acid transporter [Betaproteobacteria bacterium]